MSDVLRTALSASIRLDQMPKTCVDVFVMVGVDRVGAGPRGNNHHDSFKGRCKKFGEVQILTGCF